MNELKPGFSTGSPSPRGGRFPISSSVISGIGIALDSLVILSVGAILYFQMINISAETMSFYSAAICSIWLTIIMLFHFSELYRFSAITRPLAVIDKIVISFGTGFLLLLAAAFAFKVTALFSRTWLVSFAVGAISMTVALRWIFSLAVLQLARRGFFSRSVIVIGDEAHARALLERIRQRLPDFAAVTGVFIDGATSATLGEDIVTGGLSEVSSFVRSSRVDDVVVAMPWSDEQRILEQIQTLRELPVNVYLGSDLVGLRLDFREPPDHFRDLPIFSIVGRPMSGWALALKTVEDYFFGALLLLVAIIPMAIVAILIRLEGPGPVLFRQRRLGFNNRVFSIYKFRTMREAASLETTTIQARPNDDRVTKIGKFLRRSSLDELPQLFNVLNGTMSLVGPRPHAIDHNQYYSQTVRGYFARHRVKPGITGWAQVNGLRGETNTPEKMEARVRLDIFYAENWSLLFDLRILLQTFLVVAGGRNAY